MLEEVSGMLNRIRNIADSIDIVPFDGEFTQRN